MTKTLGKYGCRLRVPGTHAMVLHFFCDGILWLNTLKKHLNLSSIDIWGWLTLSGSFVHQRMSSSIPNLYALDTRSTPPLLVTTKNVPEVWMEQNRSAENHSSPGEHELRERDGAKKSNSDDTHSLPRKASKELH